MAIALSFHQRHLTTPSKNDDEDLVILGALYFGAGLNLWRGDSPSNFLDFQLGVGPWF